MRFNTVFASVTAGLVLLLGACAARDRGAHIGTNKDYVDWQERSLTVEGDRKDLCRETLGYDYPGGKIKYWVHGQDSVWLLVAQGKHGLITSRITVEKGVITDFYIVDSREVRFKKSAASGFIEQLKGLCLAGVDRLSGRVDAVTGATVSSKALERTALLALRLDGVLAP